MESPFVTAFVLLLKWTNLPIPEHASNLFVLFAHIAKALDIGGYAQDMIMDPNPSSFFSGGHNKETLFDFIIVGGGPSGCLLAMRLCENYKVLLLEAGAEPRFPSQAPLFNTFQLTSNATSWNYYSTSQETSSYSSKKKRIKYIRGKGLGGSMILGNSVYSRGNPKDFDFWASETGDESWNYKNMIKFFKKTENYKGKFDDSINHEFSGKMRVSSQSFQPLAKEWVDGAVELKLNSTDPNEFQTQTFSPVEVTITDGKKVNLYEQLLRKELWRKNLKITRYAYVEKILFEKQTAKGVIYRRGIKEVEVRATKEVILCAGVFNTPKLLMLSGLGPTPHLISKDIKVKRDLPQVGKNFQDHPSTVYGPVTVVTGKSFWASRNLTISAIMEYQANQSGVVSSNLFSGLGYYSTPKCLDQNWPNIQLTLVPVGIEEDTYDLINSIFNLRSNYMEKYLKNAKNTDAVWIIVSLARPLSRGFVELKSKKWNDSPIINPNFFSDPSDIQNLADGMKFAHKLMKTEAWGALDAKLISTQFPGCEDFKPPSEQYFDCFARHLTFSIGNAGGTCRMGKTDKDSVVDSKLLVHNIKHLRIVDASVMPLITNGYQAAAVIAIAEKAAEMIIKKWTHAVNRNRDRDGDKQ